jgi:hypothetical protein
MRIVQACAIAAVIGFSGAAFAQNTQSTTPGQVNSSGTLAGANNPNNGGPGSNLTGAVSGNGGTHRMMHEGRAAAPDSKGMNSGADAGPNAGIKSGMGSGASIGGGASAGAGGGAGK